MRWQDLYMTEDLKMKNRWIILMLFCGVTTGSLYRYDLLYSTFYLLLHLVAIVVGVMLGTSWSLVRGKQYKPPTSTLKGAAVVNSLLQKLMEKKGDRQTEPKKVVISRNTDLALQEVIDLIMRDYILSWYQNLSKDQEALLSAVKSDMWVVVKNLSTRFSKVDTVKFISQDVMDCLHKHFMDIRHSSRQPNGVDSVPKFILHPWLESSDKERAFLSMVCEVLLLLLLPDHYKGSTAVRHLFREILTSAVLKPTVDMVCDPDYINCKLISYIDYNEQVSEDTRRTYTYAATYEDFVKMIDKCEDVEHLRQIRYNIITEIMQATTIKNLQQEQRTYGKGGSPKGTGKGDFLKARNLKRYINQLTVAKSRCEKRIYTLGGPDYKYYTEDGDGDTPTHSSDRVMSFAEVMDSVTARQEFMKFLKRDDKDSLLGFWNAVEKLKNADKRHHHQIGSEIYHQYIVSSTSAVKVDKTRNKAMETFLRGDTGPEAFYEVQDQAFQILQKDFYPSFLVSDVYHRYCRNEDDEKLEAGSVSSKDQFFFGPAENFQDPEDVDEMDSDLFASQSYAAQQRLESLDEKIRNKTQAIQALQTTKKTDDTKKEKVEKDMEGELEKLVAEKKQLEAHILRMQTWSDNLGKWTAHVYETETLEEAERKTPVFVLIVHLAGCGTSQNLQKSSHGWVVSHTLSEFQNLHDKLVQIGPWLKKKDIPTIGIFTTVDDKFIQDSKKCINEYLNVVLKDERMAQSEVLCRFLTPTPDYLRQQDTSEKKKTFITNLFRSLPIRQEKEESDEDLLFTGDESTKLDRSKDSIAEPFYKLVDEVFELRGTFRWLRRSFITFMEVTFGRSINRYLRETMDWIFSEPMMIYYIRMFKDTMWPDGQLSTYQPCKSNEENLRTRIEAKQKFLKNVPEAVKILLGEKNARRGSIKIFEVLQDIRLNKHLFYVLLELFLLETCPELTSTQSSPTDTACNS